MRIAHVTPYFHPEFYGSHEAFLSEHLAARGHAVTLYTSDRMPRWGGAKGLSSDGLQVGESTWRGVRIVRVPAGPTLSFVPSLPSLPRELQKDDHDLLLSHEVFSLAAWHTCRAARRSNKPFVLIQHGYHGGRRALYRALFQLEFAVFGKRVLRAADQIISLTAKGAEFLTELGADPAKVEVVPTGVDCASFDVSCAEQPMSAAGDEPTNQDASSGAIGPNGRDATFRVGYLGRVDHAKGTLDLLEAFARSFPAEAGASARLEFAGVGDATADLATRAAELGLSERVALRGRMPHAEVPDFLGDQDVLCVPTRVVEPFGIVAVEAAAAGKPCIASRIGGLAETVVDGATGYLLEPGDVEGLSQRLGELAADEGLRTELGVAARERARTTYDWPRVTDRFEALFESLAG